MLVYAFEHIIYKENFVTSTTKSSEDRVVAENNFYMLLNLSLCKFKLEYYTFGMLNTIPMVTTKKMPIEYTQREMRKELKHFITKISTEYGRR